ncbi:unnamed protein product [Sphagnum balticum]
MVSKLGFFSGTSFLLSTSRALKWPAKTIIEKATMKKPMAAAAVWFKKTSNIPGATSRALKWSAKTIVGKATVKKPRSKMAAAAVRLRLQQSPNDAFGNRWTS